MEKSSIRERIDEKIEEINKFIEELSESFPRDLELEDYKTNFKIKAICERYFEKIIEAVEDLAFLVMHHKNLKYPEYDKEIFDILHANKIISNDLTKKLKDAKGMRNFIAHQYGKIDDELVFYAVKDELENDVEEFIKCVELALK